jgi:glycosyltransferase involved in cell wall biosynthesis
MAKSVVTFEIDHPDARVLVVTNMWPNEQNPYYGIFVQRQVESLAQAGIVADVMFVRGYLNPAAYAKAALILFWRSVFGRKRYRLIHAHSETAVAARFYFAAPLLVTYHGDDLLGARIDEHHLTVKSRVVSAVLRQHARFARATITQSKQMEERLPRSRQRVNNIIPCGVNEQVFVPRDRDAVRSELGWDLDQPIALFAAKPEVKCKGYSLAETICRRATVDIPDLSLQVISDVAQEAVPDYMNAADCLLFTSFSEGAGLVVKEAVMCNLPVVTTRVGDVEEVLANVHPSYVCDAREEELSAALVSCLGSRSRSNGRAVSSWLTLGEIANRIAQLYMRLAPELFASPVKSAVHD